MFAESRDDRRPLWLGRPAAHERGFVALGMSWDFHYGLRFSISLLISEYTRRWVAAGGMEGLLTPRGRVRDDGGRATVGGCGGGGTLDAKDGRGEVDGRGNDSDSKA